MIEPTEKTAPPLGRLVIDHLRAAVVRVRPLRQQDGVRRRVRRSSCPSRGRTRRRGCARAGSPRRRGRRRAARCPRRPSAPRSRTRYGAAVMMPARRSSPRRAGWPPTRRCDGSGCRSRSTGSFGSTHAESPPSASNCVLKRSVASSRNSTSQLRPLPPRYISRPPRSKTQSLTRRYIARDQYSGCTVIDQDLVGVEVERAVVQLVLRVEVVGEALAFQPAEEAATPPGRGGRPGGPRSGRSLRRARGRGCPARDARTRAARTRSSSSRQTL